MSVETCSGTGRSYGNAKDGCVETSSGTGINT